MKTIYLVFWIINAILLAIFAPDFKDLAPFHVINALFPLILLIIRLVLLHENEDEKNIPI